MFVLETLNNGKAVMYEVVKKRSDSIEDERCKVNTSSPPSIGHQHIQPTWSTAPHFISWSV